MQRIGKLVNQSLGTRGRTQAYRPFCGKTLPQCQCKTGTAERMGDDRVSGPVAFVELDNDIGYFVDTGMPAGAFSVSATIRSRSIEVSYSAFMPANVE